MSIGAEYVDKMPGTVSPDTWLPGPLSSSEVMKAAPSVPVKHEKAPATTMKQGRKSGEDSDIKGAPSTASKFGPDEIPPQTHAFPQIPPTLCATPAAVSVQDLQATGIDMESPLTSRSNLGHAETMLSRASQPISFPCPSPLPMPPTLKKPMPPDDLPGNSQPPSASESNTAAILPRSDDRLSSESGMSRHFNETQNEPFDHSGGRTGKYVPPQRRAEGWKRALPYGERREQQPGVENLAPVSEQSQSAMSVEEQKHQMEAPSGLMSEESQSDMQDKHSAIVERIESSYRKLVEAKRSMKEATLELVEDLKRQTAVCVSKIWQVSPC